MKKGKALSAALLLSVAPLAADAQTQGTGSQPTQTLKLDARYSYRMLEPSQDLRKLRILMEERQAGTLKSGQVIFGASVTALVDYQWSDVDSKFGYLMRHPTAKNQVGDRVSEAVLHSFQLGVSGAVNDWMTGHAEILYDPQQSFGQGTITDLNRNQLQLRKAYALIGDLNAFPVYLAIGKFDGPFGQTDSVSPFTNSTMWHAFGTLGYGAQLTFDKSGLEASFMAAQGGAQFRALNTIVGDGTNVPSRLNNWIADLNYEIRLGDVGSLTAGASYVRGSAYCHSFPVVHFEPCEKNNGARTAYGRLRLFDHLLVKGGYAITDEEWPGTFNPTPPLDVFPASKVSALDVGARYDFALGGDWTLAASAEFSNFRAGPSGSPWERQSQLVLGGAAMLNHSKLFLELFRLRGYVPLNFVSGGNLEPGETHSVNDTTNHGIVLGAHLTF